MEKIENQPGYEDLYSKGDGFKKLLKETGCMPDAIIVILGQK